MLNMSDKETHNSTSESIRVSIFDQTYSLRSQSGGEHVAHIAQVVDERMRQISSHATTFELSRIAVLAALNIADEMETLKAYYEQEIQKLLAQSSDPSEAHKSPSPESKDETNSRETNDKQSWFEAIFDDAEAPAKNRSERLSSHISAKLQSLRQTDSEAITIDIDEKS